MKHLVVIAAALSLGILNGCGGQKHDPAAQAPPPAQVVEGGGVSVITVDHPNRFPIAAATDYQATSVLKVTGTVNPDISKQIPVISIASGRVVAVHTLVGAYVQKGQLLMEVQSTDISNAFDQYLKAVNDERLARTQDERANSAEKFFQSLFAGDRDLCSSLCSEKTARKSSGNQEVHPSDYEIPSIGHFLQTVRVPAKARPAASIVVHRADRPSTPPTRRNSEWARRKHREQARRQRCPDRRRVPACVAATLCPSSPRQARLHRPRYAHAHPAAPACRLASNRLARPRR